MFKISDKPEKFDNPPFAPPRSKQVLWHYLTVPKLRTFLVDRALWLARANTFADKLEGTFNYPSEQQLISHCLQSRISLEDAQNLWRQTEIDRWITYISCWRMDTSEDERAWQEYPATLAIRTTYEKLKIALLPDLFSELQHPIKFGVVQYIDRLVDQIAPQRRHYPLMSKSHAYLWENEFRVVWCEEQHFNIVGNQLFDKGIMTPDTRVAIGRVFANNDFIDEIIIGPTAPQETLDEVKVLLNGFNKSVPIRNSIFGSRR